MPKGQRGLTNFQK